MVQRSAFSKDFVVFDLTSTSFVRMGASDRKKTYSWARCKVKERQAKILTIHTFYYDPQKTQNEVNANQNVQKVNLDQYSSFLWCFHQSNATEHRP